MVELGSGDFLKGNPAHRVVGKPTEQPARYHAPQPPKPTVSKIKSVAELRRNMLDRMADIRPALEETKTLEKLLEVIEGRRK